MNSENEKILKETIKRVCKVENVDGFIDEKLGRDSCDLKNELGFDSLLFVELVVEIEEGFGIEFDVNNLNINNLRILGELKKSVDILLDERQ